LKVSPEVVIVRQNNSRTFHDISLLSPVLARRLFLSQIPAGDRIALRVYIQKEVSKTNLPDPGKGISADRISEPEGVPTLNLCAPRG